MAVILDIPMPGGCGSCPLNEDNWGCIVTGKPVQEDGRPEDCPLHGVMEKAAEQIEKDLLYGRKVKNLMAEIHTAPGSGPSGSGPNPTEINRADGAAARKEVR